MKIILGLTGASGSILFKRTVEILAEKNYQIAVIATKNGIDVFTYELGIDYQNFITGFHNVEIFEIDNMFAQIASGSSGYPKMLIVPCSMGTVGNIANGTSNNLLIRAADVILKEKKQLVLAVRETPLNNIHLKNMQIINDCGGFVVPQVPSFYNKRTNIEQLIDDIVYRNLSYIGVELPNDIKWKNNA